MVNCPSRVREETREIIRPFVYREKTRSSPIVKKCSVSRNRTDSCVIRHSMEWCCSASEAVTSLRSSLFPRKRRSAADRMLTGDINGRGRLNFWLWVMQRRNDLGELEWAAVQEP